MAHRANRLARSALFAAIGVLAAAGGCAEPAPAPEPGPERVRVSFAGQALQPEVALTGEARYRGLSGRDRIPRDGGMLFAWPDARPREMVMRDCPAPIDVAFLDVSGRVLAVHTMPPEPPRRADESDFDYERRLPGHASGEPAVFALETAGGRLAELGLAVGDRLVFDARALLARAR